MHIDRLLDYIVADEDFKKKHLLPFFKNVYGKNFPYNKILGAWNTLINSASAEWHHKFSRRIFVNDSEYLNPTFSNEDRLSLAERLCRIMYDGKVTFLQNNLKQNYKPNKGRKTKIKGYKKFFNKVTKKYLD